jgi:hypothetical protein
VASQRGSGALGSHPRARSGRGERGRRGGGGVVRRRGAGAPFYRVRGGAGRPDGEGNRAAGGGAPLLAIRFSGEGKWRGCVGSEEGQCGAISGRGGDVGAVRALEAAAAVFGRLHPEEEGS